MVMTILEASVERQDWQTLQAEYSSAVKKLDPGIVQTYLLQARGDENRWQIATLWESQEALTAMRGSGETPRGVLIFRSVHAEPTLSVLRVVAGS